MDESLRRLARKAVWWKPPEEAVADTNHFLAHALTVGNCDDWKTIERGFTPDQIRACLENPPVGIFDQGTWNLWRNRLGLPEARLPTTRPFDKRPARSVEIDGLTVPGALQAMIAKGETFIVSENGKPLAEVIPLSPDLAAKTPSQGIAKHGPQELVEIASIDQASVMDRSSVCQLLGIASPEEADRACRVWPVASHLFTTDEAVAEWLKAPEVHFNGDTPLTKLRTEEGTEEVIALLWGLVYGNFQ